MIKFTILLRRNPALTHEQFVEHHRGVHAALFMSVPVVKETVLRYVQQHTIAAALPGMPPVTYDGITELWFADVRALGRCFSDPEYMARVRPDEAEFLDLHRCDFIVSEAHEVWTGKRHGLASGRWP